jgi:hypothetical protein
MSNPVITPEILAEMELDDLRDAAEARGISSNGNAPTVRARIRKWQDAQPAPKKSAADSKSDAPTSKSSSKEAPDKGPAASTGDKPDEGAEPVRGETASSSGEKPTAESSVKVEEAATPSELTPSAAIVAPEVAGNQSPAPPVLPSPTSQVVSLNAQSAPLVTAYTTAPPAQTEPVGGEAPAGISFSHQRLVAEGNTLVRLHGDNKVRKVCTPIEHGGRARANSLYGSRVAGFVNDEITAPGAILLPNPAAAVAAPEPEQP